LSKTYKFQVSVIELQNAVKHLYKLLSKIKPKPNYPILDVIVKLDSAELRLIGMSRFIQTNHKIAYSFTIPFVDFYAAALGSKEEIFSASVLEGSIKIADRQITSNHIKLIHPENVPRFDLAMNSSI
jgi:hypothetical protein